MSLHLTITNADPDYPLPPAGLTGQSLASRFCIFYSAFAPVLSAFV
jgi:hypothetical protein